MGKKKLCVPKDGVGDAELEQNLDWSCAQGVVGCGPIQPDVVCVEPATVRSRATFAMNSYYRRKGGIESACDFSSTAQTTTKDPNYSGRQKPPKARNCRTKETFSGKLGSRSTGHLKRIAQSPAKSLSREDESHEKYIEGGEALPCIDPVGEGDKSI
ncbi:hypothetical protein V6N11_070623 [Hibiscus sabdariffa]|uniref:X8 domain-containing protein n=1 Tax=Hibiscus sabdariffa TaxID=183260 RepID=A0ABR2QFJ6_9ROSI